MNSTSDIINNITHQSNSNIDNLAQSFFILLIFCSCLSDFIILKNGGLSEKVNNISDAIYGVVFNKCNKDEKGNIVIDKKEIEDFLKDSDDESEATTIDLPVEEVKSAVVVQDAPKREKDEKDKKERRHKKKKSKDNKVE